MIRRAIFLILILASCGCDQGYVPSHAEADSVIQKLRTFDWATRSKMLHEDGSVDDEMLSAFFLVDSDRTVEYRIKPNELSTIIISEKGFAWAKLDQGKVYIMRRGNWRYVTDGFVGSPQSRYIRGGLKSTLHDYHNTIVRRITSPSPINAIATTFAMNQ